MILLVPPLGVLLAILAQMWFFSRSLPPMRQLPPVIVCLNCLCEMLQLEHRAGLECPKCRNLIGYREVELSPSVVWMTRGEFERLWGNQQC